MRYNILEAMPVPSIFIDAPYDSLQDAKEDINNGIKHNCEYCYRYETCIRDTIKQTITLKK